MNDYTKTERNTVNRVPKRGHYDKKTVFEILDAGIICHVGFVIEVLIGNTVSDLNGNVELSAVQFQVSDRAILKRTV